MKKVVSIGECLIDLIPFAAGDVRYTAKAGGAPANVCACVAKLGGVGQYLGKLSDDGFSDLIIAKLKDAGVCFNYAVRDGRYSTAMALVTLTSDGDRSFSFYRTRTADLMYEASEVPQDIFEKGDVLHFCSVGLVKSPLGNAHRRAIALARKAGAYVSFDVNVRLALYPSESSCRRTINKFLAYADIVKVTDEELSFITGERDEKKAVGVLLKKAKHAEAVFVTKGADGAAVYDRSMKSISVPAPDVKVVDTTGAGDCFIGSILFKVCTEGLPSKADKFGEYLTFASAACGIVCASQGAIESMPTYAQVTEAL